MVGKAAKAKGEANALEPPPAEEAEAALEEDGGSGAKEGSSLLDHVRELYPLGSDAAKGGLSAADVLAALSARMRKHLV
ncbi:unnamed protein product [Ostreobium quekettii]|uniref:Uncharacterized protein n=1 Tax=Ostreobium quekettii TaxID=121088 RepID=A0A8S1J189_9CHLO|nr:unnamed protein product [Ostreobium quekettii]